MMKAKVNPVINITKKTELITFIIFSIIKKILLEVKNFISLIELVIIVFFF